MLMNFQTLQKVEDSDFYLGLAFRNAKEAADKIRELAAKSKEAKSKKLEILKISTVRRTLHSSLEGILKSFPSIDQLPPFYRDLINITLEYADLKQSLGALNWAMKQIDRIHGQHATKIKQEGDIGRMNLIRKSFYGRVSSVMKQIKNPLKYLEHCRREMKGYPNIKTSIFSVAIAGYPNVGKSSLLRALTTAKPAVNTYPFTTKNINLGYMTREGTRIQLIDVPGTFDRKYEEMNKIEKQSFLVLKQVAGAIIFVLDPSESCGYSLSEQKSLHRRIAKMFPVPIILIQNKADISKIEGPLAISTKEGVGVGELGAKILELAVSQKPESKDEDN
jgi:nucleolar GTP-binding protein